MPNICSNLKKLEQRSKKHTFVGYSTNESHLWDDQKRRIIIARDVIFSSNNEIIKEWTKITKAIVNTQNNVQEDIQDLEEIENIQALEESEILTLEENTQDTINHTIRRTEKINWQVQ